MSEKELRKGVNKGAAWNRAAAAGLCVLVMLFLIFSLVKAVAAPKDINYYENRLAVQMPILSFDSFASGSFQKDMDSALADQIPGAQRLKQNYNEFWASFMGSLNQKLSEKFPDTYFHYDTISLFGSHIVFPPKSYENRTAALEKQAEVYNEIARDNPETKFYAYAIETDADIDFETGEKRNALELVKNSFSFPTAGFEVDSFEQYSQLFYCTDHHWNHRGSYAAYCELGELLGFEPFEAGEPILLQESFVSSKALGYLELDYSDAFYVYDFPYPAMKCMVGNREVGDFGKVSAVLSGEEHTINYGLYGDDYGQIVLSTDREELDDLLIMGDSYDNALVKLLASHHDETHSVDLRYYNDGKGGFDMSSYIAENGIEKVLLIGSTNVFFGSEDFVVEN